ncbi:MAG TPA: PLP-dependent aminotransferase family protein [Solirubrobacterales bacterium]|nr:PLP-dependent aminotransferase family protein [Solirubrobacterales bacterium]
MSDLNRGSETSLTQQLVDVIATAIESGELAPEEKLPPTRELAEVAGVNHLTAVRAYRRLRELGLVSAHVGRGTFVRGAARPPESTRVADSISWQRFALPDFDELYGDRVLAEMHQHVHTEGLIPFSVGYPSERIFPTDAIREAADVVLREEADRALQYSDVMGVPELTAQIAALSAARGAPEDPRDILITNGASQALALTMRALLEPGDAVACEDPSFMSVIRAVRASGARVLGVPVDEDGLDVDALEELLSRTEIKLLGIQPRLHNPTGRDLSPQRRERLLELARRHGFFIVEDGIYGDLRFEGSEPGSLRAAAPAHVIYCDSLSKTLAGGLRCGWVAASGPVLERIVAEKRADDIHSNTLTQLVVARYLASGAYPEQAARAREFYREHCAVLLEAIEEHLGSVASYVQPLGGGHVWVTLDLPLSERELVEETARNGVAYVPGGAMRIERSRNLSMRLSFGYLEPGELVEGVRRIATSARALSPRPARREVAPV